ncbi:MAG: ferritin-like domain-containing protein, partial [Polyangiales bacterium]
DLAAAEHASIASFARVSLALLAHGAPADLIADTHRAALDEIEHARTLYRLAAGDVPLGPAALAMEPFVVPSLPELIVSTFEDACVAEARGALSLVRLAEDERDPEIALIFRQIHEDELRHVVLAWRTLAWAIACEGEAGVNLLETKLASLSEAEDAIVREVVRPCATALLSSARRAARSDSRPLPGGEPRARA